MAKNYVKQLRKLRINQAHVHKAHGFYLYKYNSLEYI